MTVDKTLPVIARTGNRDRGARDRGPDDDGGQTAGAVLALALVGQASSFGEAFVLLTQPARG
jgi:hypothetical protein